jgi:protein-tyrosine phosphatase
MKESASDLAVLFVCLGNICRSPMAEGAFCRIAEDTGLACRVDSAGTASYHVGEPPDPRAISTAAQHGVDISYARGRQLHAQDFERFSHIIALDKANLAGILAVQPRRSKAHVALLMDAVEGRAGEPVKDPYHGDADDFAAVWADVSLGARALAERLRAEGSAARF